jgi:hypothetical protein
MLWSIIHSTLGELATGILIFIAFVPPSKIGKGFGRFHSGLALVLWLLALRGNLNVIAFVLFSFLVLTFLFSWNDLWYYIFLFCSIACSFLVLVQTGAEKVSFTRSFITHLPSILVLGASSISMLLGHWYLVAPKLPISYLKLLTVSLIAAILIRSGILAWVLAENWTRLESLRFFELYAMFFVQRLVLGLVLTLVLSILTYYCVRIRSTQSATGILYVVLVFCLIGEIIGSYLNLKTGLLF